MRVGIDVDGLVRRQSRRNRLRLSILPALGKSRLHGPPVLQHEREPQHGVELRTERGVADVDAADRPLSGRSFFRREAIRIAEHS